MDDFVAFNGIYAKVRTMIHSFFSTSKLPKLVFRENSKLTLPSLLPLRSLQFFGETKPARSCVEVARLPKDVLVEVEVRKRATGRKGEEEKRTRKRKLTLFPAWHSALLLPAIESEAGFNRMEENDDSRIVRSRTVGHRKEREGSRSREEREGGSSW